MQLEDPFDTKLCTLKFIVFSTLTVLASGVVRKLWREWERKVGDWHKNESEDRDTVKTQLPSCEVCSDVDEYNKKEQQLAKQRSTWPYWEMTVDPQTLLMNTLPSFSILSSHFHCTWTTDPKACATPTNGNTHVTARSYWDTYVHSHAEWVRARHTLRVSTPSMWSHEFSYNLGIVALTVGNSCNYFACYLCNYLFCYVK